MRSLKEDLNWDGYRPLKNGEKIQIGDEAWTWIDPDCTELGWFVIEQEVESIYDNTEMVTMRRKVEKK